MVFLSMVSFLLFTDMCIYWIHRFLHHKLIYKVSLTVHVALAEHPANQHRKH